MPRPVGRRLNLSYRGLPFATCRVHARPIEPFNERELDGA
jgi:hypothetical protein